MSYIDPNAEESFFVRQKEILSRLGIKESPNIFDVGGNIGQSIDAYRKLFPAAAITTFEPLPDCFSTLRQNYGSVPGIKLENCALSKQNGSMPFYSTKCRAASSLFPPDEAVQKKSVKGNYDYDRITVCVETLDDYCLAKKTGMIDILKIDVQGAELDVLIGARKLLTENRIRFIYVEVIFADNYKGQSDVFALAAFLAQYKYILWDIRPFLFTKSGRLWTANAMFASDPTRETLENCTEEFPVT